jgi:hypothetical protein
MLIPKTKYIRSERYLKTVRGQPCLSCGRPGEAHHVNFAMRRGISMKVGDDWVVPLCHPCHMELHHFGDEITWWAILGFDPLEWAKASWKKFNGEQ